MTGWTIVARDRTDVIGEGTYWSARENAVFWVDALGPCVNRMTLGDNRVASWTMPEPLGWIIERQAGGFIAGTCNGFARLDLEPFDIAPRIHPEPHLPGNRLNDAKADAQGRIWFNTLDSSEEQDCGSLYRLDPDGRWMWMDIGYREGPDIPLYVHRRGRRHRQARLRPDSRKRWFPGRHDDRCGGRPVGRALGWRQDQPLRAGRDAGPGNPSARPQHHQHRVCRRSARPHVRDVGRPRPVRADRL
jgi:hypothetical protein